MSDPNTTEPEANSASALVASLREQVVARQAPEDGAIVTFDLRVGWGDGAEWVTHVALCSGDTWHITSERGDSQVGRSQRHEEFLTTLAKSNVKDVYLATDFEGIV